MLLSIPQRNPAVPSGKAAADLALIHQPSLIPLTQQQRAYCLFAPHRNHLLGFVGVLDDRLGDIAARFNVALYMVHAICELQALDQKHPTYWQRRGQLQAKLGHNYHQIEQFVLEAMSDIPRASSLVENLNSRLQNYFFLRRHIGNDYLDLLRLFLNHHRYIRSDRSEHIGKSPAELMTGQPHAHWLEMLGFECDSAAIEQPILPFLLTKELSPSDVILNPHQLLPQNGHF